ncbi:uncharacterized protein [Apostichopus japonicus]
MTSSRSQYTDTLQKVSNVLTEKNVKDLGFLCDGPSLVKGVTNANELFEVMQDQDLLSERKVNVLIDWLDELELSKASKFLKDYKTLHVTEYRSSCHIHEDQTMTHFCVKCNTKVCPECYAIEHNKHDKLIAGNPTEIESIKENPKSVENLVNKRKNITDEYGEDIPSLIRKDCLDLMENISKCKRDLIAEVDRKELSDKKRMMKTKRDVQVLEEELEHLGKLNDLTAKSTLQELQTINAAMKQTIYFKKQLDRHSVLLDIISDDLLYRKIPNDGLFGTIAESTLVGTTTVAATLLLHMHDERHLNGNVLLVFVDLNDTSNERFKHHVKIANRCNPVVMSNIGMYYEGRSHQLFAVGNTVFIVHPQWTGSLYDSVGSVSSLMIDDLPEGSWITSLTAHYPGTGSYKEFVISVDSDCILREYNVSGSRTRTIDATQFLPCNKISKVAYFMTFFAIIVQGVNDVIMISTEGAVHALGSLKPKNTVLHMVPINIVWTGVHFLVLYISKGEENKWKVVSYYLDLGTIVDKLGDEGTSDNPKDVAVNVTRCSTHGYVSFANCTTRKFQYPSRSVAGGTDYLSVLNSLLGYS